MEQVDYTTETIHPKSPISQVHVDRNSRHRGPPSSFANTRWGREEIAGKHYYLADGTYIRRPKRRRGPAPQAFPNISLQEPSSLAERGDAAAAAARPSSSTRSPRKTSRQPSRRFSPAHIFSWPMPHPLKSSPTPQALFEQVSETVTTTVDEASYSTVLREPPRVRTLRHERRPLTDAVLTRHSFDNPSIANSPSLSKRRTQPSLGTRSLAPTPMISPLTLDTQNLPPDTAMSPDLRYATAAAIRRTDEQAQIRFSPPPPSLPVFGSVGGRSRKRRHHSTSSSSSGGAWWTSASNQESSATLSSSPSRPSSLVLWLGVLFGRSRRRRSTSDETEGQPRRRRHRRKRRRDDDSVC